MHGRLMIVKLWWTINAVSMCSVASASKWLPMRERFVRAPMSRRMLAIPVRMLPRRMLLFQSGVKLPRRPKGASSLAILRRKISIFLLVRVTFRIVSILILIMHAEIPYSILETKLVIVVVLIVHFLLSCYFIFQKRLSNRIY